MSLIKTPQKELSNVKKVDKKILDNALATVACQTVTDPDGSQITYAQGLAQRLWQIALFGEKEKDSISASKIILERINGKPATLIEEEKEEIPTISFRVHPDAIKKVENLASKDVVPEPDISNKLIVSIDDQTMEF